MDICNGKSFAFPRFFILLIMIASISAFNVGCSGKAEEVVLTDERTFAEAVNESDTDVVINEADMTENSESACEKAESSENMEIYVHICGAVNAPGVYKVSEGTRAVDVVEAAGGFTDDAECSYVNLAKVVEDQQRIYVPTVDEVKAELTAAVEAEGGGDSTVNINNADAKELIRISGIGNARAKDIVEYRKKNGRFSKKEDIMKVSGIKQALFDKIKDEITVE